MDSRGGILSMIMHFTTNFPSPEGVFHDVEEIFQDEEAFSMIWKNFP